MPVPTGDLALPTRLLAGGGPSSPDPRVLRALTTPLIGQFDPAFTASMDDVVTLARHAFRSVSSHCFAISALGRGGLEAVLNSLIETETQVAVGGEPGFVAETADLVRRLNGQAVSVDRLNSTGSGQVKLVVVPFGVTALKVQELASLCHARGARLVVDATFSLGVRELRVDDWGIDVCLAPVEYGIGAPAGMSLVTYTAEVSELLQARRTPPISSYLDLIQLQAYWSPDRLNHHTAPTSLVYGLREALRLIQDEGIAARWHRHAEVGWLLRDGLTALGLSCDGALPYSLVHLPSSVDETRARHQLRDRFGVQVTRVAPRTWRLGLLGAEARPDAVEHLLGALQKVLVA
jgi:aspartate aminotransferase-like enzyme